MLRIKQLREDENLRQVDIANILKVKNYTIANWEQGRSEPCINDIIKMADYFGCSTDYLLGREDDFGNVATDADLNEIEKQLLEKFRLLPEIRQKTIIDTISFMVESFNTKQKRG